MPLRSPNLDDRTFEQLLEAAKERARTIAPDWELSPNDPGTVLLELFAHLTEILLYRLNRVPEKAYIEFLNLLGLRIHPPTAAAVDLTFRLSRPATVPVEIPRGTRVTVAKTSGSDELPVFTTAKSAHFAPGSTEITVRAYHGELIEGELAGYGTGTPRLSVNTRQAPIVAATADDLALVVGVESTTGNPEGRVPSISYEGKIYRVWKEVESFTNLPPDSLAFVVDRVTGTITFAPALRVSTRKGSLSDKPHALASIPLRNREIRVWYWRGGGASGNVAAGTLTVIKDPVAGVSVTNITRASGGRAGETLQNALLRGPGEFRSLERAVTANDYETLALKNGAISRAKAFTKASLWAHATPGTVEVLLVPDLPAELLDGPLDGAQVSAFHSENARAPIAAILDERKPLGTTCIVNWARYKTVRVKARIVVYSEEDAESLRRRVMKRLYRTISAQTWRFGQTLRASHVYDMVLSEPGVNYADQIGFQVDEIPNQDVPCVTRDAFQNRTWHAASGDAVYRTMNDGEGWERTGHFPGESVQFVSISTDVPGLLAVITSLPGAELRSAVYFSFDDGETWSPSMPAGFEIKSAAWMLRDGVGVLLLATGVGLYEVAMSGSRAPVQILVDPTDADRGFNAVAVVTDVRGGVTVAAAAQENAGVFLSAQEGRPGTFRNIGLKNEDIRVLVPHYDGARAYLWAGFAAAGGATGSGAARVELLGSELAADGWTRYSKGWSGGSCWSLAFRGLNVFAASYQSGILRLDASQKDPLWISPEIGCGLPQRGIERIFQWIKSVAASPTSDVVLCGGPAGVYRSVDGGANYRDVSSPLYLDSVTLPETWLFCSGEHAVEVVEERREGI